MSRNRQKPCLKGWCWLFFSMVWLALLAAAPAWGGSHSPGGYKGASPVVILSDEFFRAMKKYADSGAVYGDAAQKTFQNLALHNDPFGRRLAQVRITDLELSRLQAEPSP